MVARSASRAASATVFSSSTLASSSSTIASTTTSHEARSPGCVVTLIRLASAPSTLAQSECACSSAFQADASERASSRTLDAELAQAASPQAIVPLPAIPGRSYVSEAATGGGVYHARTG